MKKYYAILMLAAVAACMQMEQPMPVEEPEVPQEQEETVQTYTMTIEASKGVDTKALSLGGDNNKTLNATWTENDAVEVYNSSSVKIGTLRAEELTNGGQSCKLRGSLNTAPSKGETLTLKYLSPNYSTQDGTLTGSNTSIDKVCDYAEASVTVTSVSGTDITASNADFTNKQAIVKFMLKDKATGNPSISATRLTVTAGETTITVTPSGATSELFVAIPDISSQTVSLSADITPCYVYTYEKASVTFANSQYYEITVKMTKQYADLSRVTSNFTAVDGDELRGTLGENHKISIADGATVTLSGVNINGSGTWSSGDYAGLTCLGDATINLADGTINTVKGFNQNYPGIQAAKRSGEGEEYMLTIQGTGTLNASSNGYAAGIGGGFNISCGNIIINGGEITANGGTRAAGIGVGGVNSSGSPTCGDITINGGTVAAYGGSNAAGIGNGAIYTGGSPSCGDITINGGEVTATGGSGNQGGAGIGNGYSNGSCGDITISGGKVTATGGNGSAGIGGGYYRGNCRAIIISGGTVTATGGGNQEGAAGIGGGYNSACGDITISGGTVTANGGYKGVGIGGGYYKSCGDILISGGTVEATGGEYRAGIGAGYYSTNGTITIQNTVTRVTATKGANAVHSIGISSSGRGSCGTVTIGGKTGAISESPYTYEPPKALSASTAEDVGKVIGANGQVYATVSAATEAGTTASAIIAYVGSAGSADVSSDTYKGLAIALTDANNGSKCQWHTANSGTCVSQIIAISNAITYKNGIACTETLANSNGSGVTTNCSGHTHAAATAARSYSTARPSGTSAWFLPSMGQWNLIVQGLATKKAGSAVTTNLTQAPNDTYVASNLNSVITDAGGTGLQSDNYWSSTECNAGSIVWFMSFNGGGAANHYKSNNYYVRSVLAF